MQTLTRAVLALLLCAFAAVAHAESVLASAVTATGARTAVTLPFRGTKTFQAAGTTTAGAGSVTVQVEGSIDGTNWDVIGTITLTLSTSTSSNGFTSNDRYTHHRANITAISGTGAAVSVRAEL